MRLTRGAMVMVGLVVLGGCQKEAGPWLQPQVPLAYTRFINAVPDTFATDWRFVDRLDYSPTAILLAFRSFTPYQATWPGARRLRIFTNPGGSFPDINVVSTVLVDTTVTFEASGYYTLVHVGYTRSGQSPGARLLVIRDSIPGNIGTQVAVRAVHLGAGLGSVDVFGASSTSGALPSSPLFGNLGYLGVTSYVLRAPGALAYRVTASGSTSPELAAALAPAGAAGDPVANLTTVGGSSQAGSALTGFFFPRSVAGSRAASFTAPGVVWVVDRHPR